LYDLFELGLHLHEIFTDMDDIIKLLDNSNEDLTGRIGVLM
jgi:hypothetical protein